MSTGDRHGARRRPVAEGPDYERRLKSAVADVLDGSLGLNEAMRNRQVSEPRLREALVAAGWQSRVKNPPGPRRRTFGNGARHGRSS